MNKLPKLIRFQIALKLSFDSIIQLSGTNKVWYKTHLESNFWILKVSQDFPERKLPYKNSDFKRIYHTELRWQVLLDKFDFDSKPDLEYGSPCYRETTPLVYDMKFYRCVSLFYQISLDGILTMMIVFA